MLGEGRWKEALTDLLHIKHFLGLPPPSRTTGASNCSLDWRFLHSVCHLPPFLDFGVGCHALHVFVKGIADVFEAREKRGAGGKGQKDRVWPVRKGCTSATCQAIQRGKVQSLMLESLICSSTAGQTSAWHFLYSSMHSDLR